MKLTTLFWAALMGVLAVGAKADLPDRYTKNEIIQEDDFTYVIRGTFTAKGDPGTTRENAYVLIGFEGVLKLGLLALDPVVSFKMRFQPLGGRITIPNFDPGARAYNTIGLGQVPMEAIEKIGLNNVRVAFRFLEQSNDVVIVEDSGVFMAQGKWSFNVPDGYNWNRVFYDGGFGKNDFTDHPRVSEERAKAMWNDMTLDAFEVISADLLLSDVHWWFREYDTSSEYYATLRAIDYVSEGIRRSYGINAETYASPAVLEASMIAGAAANALRGVDGYNREDILNFGPAPDPMADFAEATRALRRILDKLTALPDDLRPGENHGPYETAVRTVPAILDEPRRLRQEYRPGGVSTEDLKRGREPEFDGQGPSYEIDGQYVVTRGGERLGPYLYGLGFLTNDTFVAGDCRYGRGGQTIYDAKTGSAVGRLRGCGRAIFEETENGSFIVGYSDYKILREVEIRRCSRGLNLLPCGDDSGWEVEATTHNLDGVETSRRTFRDSKLDLRHFLPW